MVAWPFNMYFKMRDAKIKKSRKMSVDKIKEMRNKGVRLESAK